MTCANINECNRSDSCGRNENCADTEGSYICSCKDGYDGANCADIDECLNDPCSPHAKCSNTDGGFTCACTAGYVGNGFNCLDVDECIDIQKCKEPGQISGPNLECTNLFPGLELFMFLLD